MGLIFALAVLVGVGFFAWRWSRGDFGAKGVEESWEDSAYDGDDDDFDDRDVPDAGDEEDDDPY